jgi:hypothetical protein
MTLQRLRTPMTALKPRRGNPGFRPVGLYVGNVKRDKATIFLAPLLIYSLSQYVLSGFLPKAVSFYSVWQKTAPNNF